METEDHLPVGSRVTIKKRRWDLATDEVVTGHILSRMNAAPERFILAPDDMIAPNEYSRDEDIVEVLEVATGPERIAPEVYSGP
jgi:hypothetical protein